MTTTPKTLEALDEVRKTLCRIQQRHQAVGYKFDRIWDLIDAARAELVGLEEGRAQVVPDDDDGFPAGFARWYNRHFALRGCDTKRMGDCEESWRAALAANPANGDSLEQLNENKGLAVVLPDPEPNHE